MSKEVKTISVVLCIDCPWCWFAYEEILQLDEDAYQLEKASVRRVLVDEKYQQLFEQALQKYPAVRSVPSFIFKGRTQSGFIPKDQFGSFLENFTR